MTPQGNNKTSGEFLFLTVWDREKKNAMTNLTIKTKLHTTFTTALHL